jgi:hypothetical protein
VKGQLLTRRELNRALLARQFLVERAKSSTEELIGRLVGMQSQSPTAAYAGIWSRLGDFEFSHLSEAIVERRVVRLALMRGTLHLVMAEDARRLRTLLAPVLDRQFKASPFAKQLAGLDLDPVIAAGRAAVEATPCTPSELGALLQAHWPSYDGGALAQLIRAYVPLVQVPPRGVWGWGGQARHTSLEHWVGAPSETGPSLEELVRGYLAAFGPASVQDMQTWSGLTHLREMFDGLASELLEFHGENGVELFDLPNSPRPPADTPVPVRFLAEFDNVLLAHADRTRVIDPEDRSRLFTSNGIIPGAVLLDGMVQATWRLPRSPKDPSTLTIAAFRSLRDDDASLVSDEGRRLLRASAPGSDRHEVVIEQQRAP